MCVMPLKSRIQMDLIALRLLGLRESPIQQGPGESLPPARAIRYQVVDV